MEKVTIKDVAIEARVSIATASFVLGKKGEKREIKPAIVKKIYFAAEKLDFKSSVNDLSRSVTKTKSIGLIVEDISNPFFMDLAKRIETKAEQLDYRVFYSNSDNNDQRLEELIASFLQARVDGFIIVPTQKSRKVIDQLIKLKKPILLIDRYFLGQPVSHIALDNYKSALAATEYMIQNGRKKLALLTLSPEMIQTQLRQKGFESAVQKAGLEQDSKFLSLDYHSTEQHKIRSIIQFLKSNPELDGLLFSTNTIGLVALEALHKMGLIVPKDLACISFEDHIKFRLHSPPITVIAQPIEAMADKAIEILWYQLAQQDKPSFEKILLPGNFVIRESV